MYCKSKACNTVVDIIKFYLTIKLYGSNKVFTFYVIIF